MADNYFMPVRVISGKGALKSSAELLKTMGKNCLIVCGKSSARLSGALGDAQKALEEAGISYSVFDSIKQNPFISDCCLAAEKARETGADFIFGIGGGSVLDSAKAIAIYASNPQIKGTDIYTRKNINPPLRLVLAGTTAGTGSEVTGVSVLTNDETGRKKSISGPDCYADISFCDASYTFSVPYEITVSTALDALAHAVEGFFTPKCTDTLSMFAIDAISALVPCLEKMGKTGELPTEEEREILYKASIYAGIVINTCGTAFPHPLGYVLTENYGHSHGYACAVFMPAFLKRCNAFAPEKCKILIGNSVDTSRIIAAVTPLIEKYRVEMTVEEAEKFAERWDAQVPKNFLSSPGSLTKEEAVEILIGR